MRPCFISMRWCVVLQCANNISVRRLSALAPLLCVSALFAQSVSVQTGTSSTEITLDANVSLQALAKIISHRSPLIIVRWCLSAKQKLPRTRPNRQRCKFWKANFGGLTRPEGHYQQRSSAVRWWQTEDRSPPFLAPRSLLTAKKYTSWLNSQPQRTPYACRSI